MILVSSCLCGECCKYSGGHNKCDALLLKYEEEELLKICPEQLGGLTTPREPAEIKGATANEVLNGKGGVYTKSGKNVTKAFIQGAEEVLKIAQTYHIQKAILKANSPSCGKGKVYNGAFNGTLIEGNGITTELLIKAGIEVITEEDLDKSIKRHR